MRADLQPAVKKVFVVQDEHETKIVEFRLGDVPEGVTIGWYLSLGEFPIVVTRLPAAANRCAEILGTLRDVSLISPVDLVVLAGYMPGQSLNGIKKYRPLGQLWGLAKLARWRALQETPTIETTLNDSVEWFSHLAGQTVPEDLEGLF